MAATENHPLLANYQEINRRKALEYVDGEEVPRFECTSDAVAPREYDLTDQKVVLFSLSQPGFAPRCLGTNSAIRIYGLFETKEEAREHAAHVLQVEPEISMLMGEAREWIYAPANAEGLKEAEARIAERLREHKLERERCVEEYKKRKAAKGEEEEEDVEMQKMEASEAEREEETKLPEDARAVSKATLPASAQVCGQRIVVASFLTTGDDGSFIFRVYGAFDTVEEAASWVSKVVAQRVTDMHVDLITACRWAYPKMMVHSGDAPKERFRQPELEKIIDFHRTEPERVQQYKDWRKKKEEEVVVEQASLETSGTMKGLLQMSNASSQAPQGEEAA